MSLSSSRPATGWRWISRNSSGDELPGLEEHVVADRDLADVVEQAAEVQHLLLLLRQPDRAAQHLRVVRDALAVARGVGIAGVDRPGQRDDDLPRLLERVGEALEAHQVADPRHQLLAVERLPRKSVTPAAIASSLSLRVAPPVIMTTGTKRVRASPRRRGTTSWPGAARQVQVEQDDVGHGAGQAVDAPRRPWRRRPPRNPRGSGGSAAGSAPARRRRRRGCARRRRRRRGRWWARTRAADGLPLPSSRLRPPVAAPGHPTRLAAGAASRVHFSVAPRVGVPDYSLSMHLNALGRRRGAGRRRLGPRGPIVPSGGRSHDPDPPPHRARPAALGAPVLEPGGAGAGPGEGGAAGDAGHAVARPAQPGRRQAPGRRRPGRATSCPTPAVEAFDRARQRLDLQAFVNGVEVAQNLAVVRTPPGHANGVGRAIDLLGFDGMLGSVAGDDTLLVVLKDAACARRLKKHLEGLVHEQRRGWRKAPVSAPPVHARIAVLRRLGLRRRRVRAPGRRAPRRHGRRPRLARARRSRGRDFDPGLDPRAGGLAPVVDLDADRGPARGRRRRHARHRLAARGLAHARRRAARACRHPRAHRRPVVRLPGRLGGLRLRPARGVPGSRSPARRASPTPAATRPRPRWRCCPAAAAGLVAGDVTVVALSGASGAGRAPAPRTQFVELDGGAAFYKVGTVHAHVPEMERTLARLRRAPRRGWRSRRSWCRWRAASCSPRRRRSRARRARPRCARCYAARYDAEPFVRLLPAGAWPETRAVRGSNRVDVQVTTLFGGTTLLATAAIDNLAKGAAAQALQNLNLMLGWPEATALPRHGTGVVSGARRSSSSSAVARSRRRAPSTGWPRTSPRSPGARSSSTAAAPRSRRGARGSAWRARFHEGRRVTDEATLEVATAVLAGLANKRLVAALRAPRRRRGRDSRRSTAAWSRTAPHADAAALGAVGTVTGVDPALLGRAARAGPHAGGREHRRGRRRAAQPQRRRRRRRARAGDRARAALVLLSDTPGLVLGGKVVRSLDRAALDRALAGERGDRAACGPSSRPRRRPSTAARRRAWIAEWTGAGTLARLLAGEEGPYGTRIVATATSKEEPAHGR